MIKLNLGCGPFVKEGWINVDKQNWGRPGITLFNLNCIFDQWPETWRNADFIYLGHALSQFSDEVGLQILCNCFITLAPGGVIRICEMDAADLFNRYFQAAEIGIELRRLSELEKKRDLNDVRRAGKVFKSSLQQFYFDLHRWNHLFVYDRDTLISFLQSCGFRNIKECAVNKSEHPELCNMESQETPQFIFEATK
jgi:hypothetical protein